MVSKSVYGTDAKPMLICPSVSQRHVSVWSEQKVCDTSCVMTVFPLLTWWHDWSYIVSSASWMDGLGGWCGSDVWQIMLFHNYCTLTIWFKSLLYVVKWSMSLFSFYFQWVILFSVCKWSNFCVVCFWFLGWCLIFICHFVFAQEQHNLKICCLNFDPPWLSFYKSWYKCQSVAFLWQWTHPFVKMFKAAHAFCQKRECQMLRWFYSR